MRRAHGFWWAPDSTALLVARVDESPVQRWYIADPSNPGQPAAQVRYPAAGTPNAEVSLALVGLDGRPTPVGWDSAAFPYLVTAVWAGAGQAAESPLIVVQARHQREMRILAVDRQTGATTVLRADTDPHWLDIIPGVPARTASGRIVWTADTGGAHRLIVATGEDLSNGRALPVTPEGLQVREVLSVDGETVLFAASDAEPTEIGLWTYGPAGLARLTIGDGGPGVHTGVRAGGTTVAMSRSLDQDGPAIRVLRDAEVMRITSLADTPLVPAPQPVIFAAGEHGTRTALLLPSWHRPGSARLPVLMDPYGGPHGQQVQASRAAFLTSQWFAEQGFAVVIADGRGTPGRGPGWERPWPETWPARRSRIRSRRCTPPRRDAPTWTWAGSRSGAGRSAGTCPRWPCSAARMCSTPRWRARRSPNGACTTPITPSATSAIPTRTAEAYEASSLLTDAHKLSRPLLIIHGLADDNVVVAHSLRLSSALLAAGRPHSVLPLSGVTHMATQEEVAENLLLLQVDFLRRALGTLTGRA